MVALLVDSDQILGRHFVHARTDMRPFWPEWAAKFLLDPEDPEDVSKGEDVADQVAQQVLELGEHLEPRCAKSTAELAGWLVGRLADGGDVLTRWMQHWTGRIDVAEHYAEQTLVRLLFHQSLAASSLAIESTHRTDEAYMLLDQEDSSPRAPNEDDQVEAADRLVNLPLYVASVFLRGDNTEHLTLHRVPFANSKVIAGWVKHMPKLKRLEIVGCEMIRFHDMTFIYRDIAKIQQDRNEKIDVGISPLHETGTRWENKDPQCPASKRRKREA